MIEVARIVKRYGERRALDGVTFSVGRGEVVGFLGQNGAGKTTMMRILSTFLAADEGEARVAGFDVTRQPMEVRRRIGYLPEHPPVDLDHTVAEYLGFCAALRGVPKKARRRAIDSVVTRCGLEAVAPRLIGNLSKGFRQRVGLAQALVHDPEVIVLDEPTVGLDPQQIREIRNLVRSLAGGHTVLLSSHILPEVAMTCSRVLVVHRGRLAADVPVDASTGSDLEETFLRLTSGDVLPAEAASS